MRRSIETAAAFVVVALLVVVPGPRDALSDDFEDDFWLPFTHFHLGDRASAGYSALLAHSGARSYQVEIHGWAVRDFGSAYGYAVFSTRGAALAELRLALRYESLRDSDASPWDSYAAGIELELLDGRYASLGTYRYVTAYRASQNAGRCAPTLSDVVLEDQPELRTWIDVGRNPATDFPAAPWSGTSFVKVSVGFLCAAGLSGAAYSLYFDDFTLESESGDSDQDGLRDLDEEARVHAVAISEAGVPLVLPSAGETGIDLSGPSPAGDLLAGAVALELVHPRMSDLSVSLATVRGGDEELFLLWDPGFRVRALAITRPAPEERVRGLVTVSGGISREVPGSWVHLLVDGTSAAAGPRSDAGAFALSWDTTAVPEGPRALQIIVSDSEASWEGGTVSTPMTAVVDRTPPELELTAPRDGATVSGFLEVAAQAYDPQGVASVELLIDGTRVDAREREPYVFHFETMDLANVAHAVGVRATDLAGNVITRTHTIQVSNRVTAPPPPCQPACNLTGGTSSGNLAPVQSQPRGWEILLATGDRLTVGDGLGLPWTPRVRVGGDRASLILDVFRSASEPLVDGLVPSALTPARFVGSDSWRIVVRDHGNGYAGFVEAASVRFASRTSSVLSDTDGDGLSDGQEQTLTGMSPVLADPDDDGLPDGWEVVAHTIVLTVNGESFTREIWTDPRSPDTDGDGLADGDEIAPPRGWNVTDPTDPDTDGDFLLDGAERWEIGSDPTLQDTDADTLRDDVEVASRPMTLVVNGTVEERRVTTNPSSADTDWDGLSDPAEWNGAALTGYQTDPSDADTDDDGISDGDELRGTNRRPTDPLRSDSDSDGLVDGIDLAPAETWDFSWSSSFEPGLVHFRQRFHALDLHGGYAQIWTWDPDGGECVYLSDHTATATKSSDESVESVGSWINRTFLEGGEANYTAEVASYVGIDAFSWTAYERGGCDLDAPRKYMIGYRIEDHVYDVDFRNVAPVKVTDEDGQAYDHTVVEIPLEPDAAQSLLIQVTVQAGEDRTERTEEGPMTVPALQYSLHRTADFLDGVPSFENLALGASVDRHGYQFVLRIPREAAQAANTTVRDGQAYATLVLTPSWMSSAGGVLQKRAWNATTMTVGAAVSEVEQAADHIVARLAVNLSALDAALPDSAAELGGGLHVFGAYDVYVYHMGEVYDISLAESADAVWLSGTTDAEVAEFESGLTWTPPEEWSRIGIDSFGTTMGIMKIIRRGISLTSQLTVRLVPTSAVLPVWAWGQFGFEKSNTMATSVNGANWAPIFVVSSAGTRSVNIRTFDPGIEYPITETYTVDWELGNAEILDDLDDSVLLSGLRNVNLRAGLQGAAIGATLVIFGSQAVLAFTEGDTVKGSVYAVSGAVSVFGLVKGNLVFGQRVAATQGGWNSIAIRSGTVAVLAVGGILASYELFLAGQTSDSIRRLAHYETAASTVFDTMVSVVPLYGPAMAIGWQLGLGLAVGFQLAVGMVPDAMAATITSSPGRTIVFSFEYVLGVDIPADISLDALMVVLAALNESMRLCNCLNPPIPTVLVAP